MQYYLKIALSLSMLHFGLQLTYRTHFLSPCTNHFVKQQFSEVAEMCTLLL